MHERVGLCKDPLTEFDFIRESLGVSMVNHIFRVHGHVILEEESPARTFGEVGLRSLERVFSRVHGGQSSASHAECRPARFHMSEIS